VVFAITAISLYNHSIPQFSVISNIFGQRLEPEAHQPWAKIRLGRKFLISEQ
jgi:hypothetical protein